MEFSLKGTVQTIQPIITHENEMFLVRKSMNAHVVQAQKKLY